MGTRRFGDGCKTSTAVELKRFFAGALRILMKAGSQRDRRLAMAAIMVAAMNVIAMAVPKSRAARNSPILFRAARATQCRLFECRLFERVDQLQ
jgi:hypothetical protein